MDTGLDTCSAELDQTYVGATGDAPEWEASSPVTIRSMRWPTRRTESPGGYRAIPIRRSTHGILSQGERYLNGADSGADSGGTTPTTTTPGDSGESGDTGADSGADSGGTTTTPTTVDDSGESGDTAG
jgi:hypothetical protein